MKIDDIIKELGQVEMAFADYRVRKLAKLVIELAQHVKAQEPEPITEAEVLEYNEEVDEYNKKVEEENAETEASSGQEPYIPSSHADR